MKLRLLGWTLVVAIVLAALGAGMIVLLSETAPPVEAARCICPQVYAPVVCDHGKTYPNQCVADCRHAQNCVPAGGI